MAFNGKMNILDGIQWHNVHTPFHEICWLVQNLKEETYTRRKVMSHADSFLKEGK
jgi:hypothetical protein